MSLLLRLYAANSHADSHEVAFCDGIEHLLGKTGAPFKEAVTRITEGDMSLWARRQMYGEVWATASAIGLMLCHALPLRQEIEAGDSCCTAY